MPVVELDWDELTEMTGAGRGTIEDRVPMMGADVERVNDETIDVEFFPDRPDLFSIEGVALALRGFLGEETGCPGYDVADAEVEIEVGISVRDVRPYVVSAVVRGADMGERGVQSLMRLQENLHRGPGRDRAKVSIGLHDLSAVSGDLVYEAVDPSETSFLPLDSGSEMTMEGVAEDHPKGGYASIVKDSEAWPVIRDGESVISFPPVINAARTELTPGSRDVLVEITGTDWEVLEDALAVLCAAFVERGGDLEAVRLMGELEGETPVMEPETWTLDPGYVRDLLGIDLSDHAVEEVLGRMRMDASLLDDELVVEVPRYRSDVLHRADLAEDVAIGFGYDEVEPEFPETPGIGEVHPVERRGRELREALTGFGVLEVMTLTLGNEDRDYRDLRRSVSVRRTVLENPISEEHTMVRTSLLPSLLEILSHNRHRDLPQRVFEYGEVVLDAESRYGLCAVSVGEEADFTESRSLADAVMREMGLDYEVEESSDGALMEGRRADVILNGERVGVFGEVHPEVLESFGLLHPVAALELSPAALEARGI